MCALLVAGLAAAATLDACSPSGQPGSAASDRRTRSRAAVAGQPGALQFNGSTQFVTFGSEVPLGAQRFTLETWFKRTGTGSGTSTGTGGLGSAIPLVAKGRAEAETPANLNMNYFLGIDASTGVLVADFEDTANGGNHPVMGATAVTSGVWHHAAATYDGSTWRLYLDGVLDRQLFVGFTPEAASSQHASLGSALNSTGIAAGFFQGVLDEARIWSYARSDAEILAGRDQEIRVPTAGLLGRWGMDDGTGSATVADASDNAATGTLLPAAAGPTWVDGKVFPNTVPPSPVQGVSALGQDGAVHLSWAPNAEADLAGYRVHRTTSPPAGDGPVVSGASLLAATSFDDVGLANGTTYYYAVVAVDLFGNASAPTEASATPAPVVGALQFDGASQYVDFGAAPALGAAQLTLEAWFMRTGAGTGTSTGTGGVASAIPLVAKGRAEAEAPANLNMNYFLGIDATTGVLVADFEDTANGGNHPVAGATFVTSGVWHHAAATYDGSTWRLYLDGVLDARLAVGSYTPESTSIQHASLASALNSSGVAAGFFQGLLDEARIWTTARGGDEIRASKDLEIAAAPGLVGRWSMNQTAGSLVDTAGASTGALVGAPSYVAGYSFPADVVPPPAVEGLVATAADGSVALVWAASAAADVAGYRVYRSTTAPDAALVSGSDLLRTTAFTDATVANGTSYHYAVYAVDGSNNTSAPSEISATPLGAPTPANALQFDGSSQYVTFGPAAALGAAQFTLETWFARTGSGVGTSTGTGGIANAVPLIAKGRAEAESPANLNMNYFLGIDATSGVLVADFEDTVNGANHPVSGATPVTGGGWHHAAATYDGTTWRLYLDGALDAELAVGSYLPESTSIQHASLATALNSSGVPAGFFQGALDEARIWRRARTAAEIRQAHGQEIVSDPDLLGRWGMNQASGALKTSAGNVDGTLVGGPAYVPGLTFPVVADTTPPAAPGGVQAAGQRYAIDLRWAANAEPDLAGYRVYRSRTPGGPTTGRPVTGSAAIAATSFHDVNVGVGVPYFYAVVAVDRAGNASSASPEVSASASEGDGDVTFIGAGDIAICGNNYYPQTGAIIAGTEGRVFTIGDNSNEQGTPAQYATCYDPYWGVFKERTRPGPGNHDYTTPGAAGYFGYFGDAAGPSDRGYYSYDIGAAPNLWHVIVLNSECSPSDGLWLKGGCDADSDQHRWLVADLASAPTNNIIAIWHKPRFSSAGNNAFMAQLWQDLWEGGAELVLGGHWHVYERLAPMDPAGDLDPDFGVRQFVVGTGGASPAGFGTPLATSQVRNAGGYGVIKFTLRQDSYDWQFISIPGQTFTDSGTQAVHGHPYAAPAVASVAPASGTLAGGADVTIAGSGFRSGATVTFGGAAAASVAFVSATQLTARTPPHAAGAVAVAVRNPDGQEAALDGAFVYLAPPVVAAVSPTHGPAAGRTSITITGAEFQPGAAITLGGVAATEVAFRSPTELTATTPAHPAGEVEVVVTNPDGQLATGAYTYDAPPSLSAIAPTAGPAAGGTVVTISGANFQPGAAVSFGQERATDVAFVSASSLVATAPAGGAGAVDVVVMNPDGQRSGAVSFTYLRPPHAIAVTPASGPTAGGTLITLDGTDLEPGASVALGGSPATEVVVTGTTLTARTPAHAAGPVDVVVTNPDGQASRLAGAFTFVAPPALSAVSPPQGPAAGGTPVVLSGSGFAVGMTVRFGAALATSVLVTSDTQASAVTPAGAIGTVAVTVTNRDGQSGTLAAAFTYLAPAPVVTSVSPSSGTIAGETAITLKGKNFLAGATVMVDGHPATGVTVTSGTSIGALTPAGALAGTVSITVTNPDGQSGSLADVYTYVAPPPTPTGLALTLSGKRITATWTASAGATSYLVLRATSSAGPYAQVGTPSSTTYADNGLKLGMTYCYEIRARNAAGTSQESAYACATPSR